MRMKQTLILGAQTSFYISIYKYAIPVCDRKIWVVTTGTRIVKQSITTGSFLLGIIVLLFDI